MLDDLVYGYRTVSMVTSMVLSYVYGYYLSNRVYGYEYGSKLCSWLLLKYGYELLL